MKKKFDWDKFTDNLLGAIIVTCFFAYLICATILIVQGLTGQIELAELEEIAHKVSIYHMFGLC